MDQDIFGDEQRQNVFPNEPAAGKQEAGWKRPTAPAEQEQFAEVAVGGSSAGAITGAGAAVLAIVGLAGALPFYMLTIATIALGAGLFIESNTLGVVMGRATRQGAFEESVSSGGFALGAMAGAGGIVLGILALLGVLPGVLVPIALITMGGAMAFTGPSRPDIHSSAMDSAGAPNAARRAARQSASSISAVQTLAGIAAVTLGIVSLTTVLAVNLSLVSLLVLGAALLVADTTLLGRVGTSLARMGRRR